MTASFPSLLPCPLATRRFARRAASAFTLVEMLVVMGVIVLIIGIASPVVTSLSGAGDVNKSVYDIAGLLEQSRAYAMSNDTYVYVGFHEADVNTVESGRQTEVLSPQVGGRVSVAVIASQDGTRGYSPSDTTTWPTYFDAGEKFLTIGKVQRFNNLHIVYLNTPPDPSIGGGMVRGPYDPMSGSPTAGGVDTAYNLGNAACQPVTYFEYPLGNKKGAGNYTFNKVIQYDPQGVARIQEQNNTDTIVKLIEIGLQQTHGDTAPALAVPAYKGNIAALQIECMTGSTHIYRP